MIKMFSKKNMTEIVKFNYVVIIFLSLLFVTMNVNAGFKCLQNSDCPQNWCPLPFKPRCSYSWCICVKKKESGNRCFQDSDCPQNMCSPPFKPGCFYGWCVPELILE
ncbi:uncharacterized protein LOC123915085 [Trifolium pratense]|uniref:uncharacterized protein LOC123915085 n=1 Tax=Trifolium pratense TaxID=57577 RepID=UPI001E691521|nr:uncharacterized protein LOC123915085 [Trifolium pratense]